MKLNIQHSIAIIEKCKRHPKGKIDIISHNYYLDYTLITFHDITEKYRHKPLSHYIAGRWYTKNPHFIWVKGKNWDKASWHTYPHLPTVSGSVIRLHQSKGRLGWLAYTIHLRSRRRHGQEAQVFCRLTLGPCRKVKLASRPCFGTSNNVPKHDFQ